MSDNKLAGLGRDRTGRSFVDHIVRIALKLLRAVEPLMFALP
jgi:hypothetical protein